MPGTLLSISCLSPVMWWGLDFKPGPAWLQSPYPVLLYRVYYIYQLYLIWSKLDFIIKNEMYYFGFYLSYIHGITLVFIFPFTKPCLHRDYKYFLANGLNAFISSENVIIFYEWISRYFFLFVLYLTVKWEIIIRTLSILLFFHLFSDRFQESSCLHIH